MSFNLTSDELQKDINLTVNVSLNGQMLQGITTLYARGNSAGHYIYRVVAPASQGGYAKVSIMRNGRYYTVVPYSYRSVDFSNALTGILGASGTVEGKQFQNLQIASNYNSDKILFKVYEGKTTFDRATLVGNSNIVTITSNVNDNIGDIALSRIDDYSPISPLNTNIELQPAAPIF